MINKRRKIFCFNEEVQLAIIDYCSHSKDRYLILSYIRNPTKLVCMKAVKQDGLNIKYIENPTDEMKLEAVKQNGDTIE